MSERELWMNQTDLWMIFALGLIVSLTDTTRGLRNVREVGIEKMIQQKSHAQWWS